MAKSPSDVVAGFYPDVGRYETLYQQLHQDPELAYQETNTAKTIAAWLQTLQYEVKTDIGGHGVVGILRNGPGPKVLLRAELDALPLEEKTGFSFASTKTMHSVINDKVEPVMHACGHDLHMSAQLAACELLQSSRELWSGTVIAVFQPAEETGAGARIMYEDGLYDPSKHDVPVPDVALGGHCMPLKAGLVKTRVGVINGSCDNIRVTLYGHGGHGSRPHTTVDPVLLASSVVMKLQTIVSRKIDPLKTAVITVGSIHSGSAANIIPDEAVLQLSVRSFSAEVRLQLLDLVTRFVDTEADLWGSPKPPTWENLGLYPIVDNDAEQTLVVADAFKAHFGDAFALDALQSAGSEDFTALLGDLPVPIVFWNYGSINPQVYDEAEKNGTLASIAGNHNSYFAPDFQPAFKCAFESYAVSALTYLLRKN